MYNGALKQLYLVAFVSVFFIAAQSVGGYLANSIAIYTDTAHLASDMIGFGMSIASLKVARSGSKGRITFGWARAEIMGTLMSVTFLLSITIWLCFEAAKRVKNPEPIDTKIMLITAVAGLFFNLIQMKILHGGEGDGHYHLGHDHGDEHDHGDDHGHDHGHDQGDNAGEAQRNINVQAAFLHVLGDLLMSVGVIIAAVIIYFKPTWTIADPICTFLFSVIVCVTVFPTIKSCMGVLMEVAPATVDVEGIKDDILACPSLKAVHEFHLWSISVGKLSLSVHVESELPLRALKEVKTLLNDKHGIDHATVQCEDNTEGNPEAFDCHQTAHLD